jgi:hypothetical protein
MSAMYIKGECVTNSFDNGRFQMFLLGHSGQRNHTRGQAPHSNAIQLHYR